MENLAPVVLFTYNRLNETRRTIEALQRNFLSAHSDLFIFSDGPKNDLDAAKVSEVRKCFKNIKGFKHVKIIEKEDNNGLANSIIAGVTEIIDIYGRIIVLEDDLITAPNFLDFMNQALDFYSSSPKIFSISGYTPNLSGLVQYDQDFYLGKRASSWGWGTWTDRWNTVDWEVTDYENFSKDYKKRLAFSRIGSDMPRMLRNQMIGKIDSWAIRWCYYQFKHDLRTVFAGKSKISHIGISKEATHAAGATRFDTPLDNSEKREFKFVENPVDNELLIREFRNKSSIMVRAKAKLKRYLGI